MRKSLSENKFFLFAIAAFFRILMSTVNFLTNRPIRNEYGKIEFKVSGLEIMKGSADKARVVYAKIQSESLQNIADSITRAFIDAGK